MPKNKLIFGVCGIGRGHIYRQLPIISYFAKSSKIAIFAFKESYFFYSKFFKKNKNVKVFLVSVPWIHGSKIGIDYLKTANDSVNTETNFISTNYLAMNDAQFFLGGKPNIVISDYEPISAQYSYSLNVPLITIDQQSKYFFEGYPKKINNLYLAEERSRLGLFFPRADVRIACSFFYPPQKTLYKNFNVLLVPPVIREEIVKLKRLKKTTPNQILIYLSPYSPFVQSASNLFKILKQFSGYNFYIFTSAYSDFHKEKGVPKNVKIKLHGDKNFSEILSLSVAVICTGGHTFISEVMFLTKPAYVVPLNTFEQKYNAKVIADNNFGIARNKIDSNSLEFFLNNRHFFKKNILIDRSHVLNKNFGQQKIINIIKKYGK